MNESQQDSNPVELAKKIKNKLQFKNMFCSVFTAQLFLMSIIGASL